MNYLKRIELWVLLALIVAGLVFVFTSKPAEDDLDPSRPAANDSGNAKAALVLHRTTLERDYGNVRLDLELRIRNDKSEKLVAQSPAVKLLSGSGREVPTFFLPFDPIPEVPAKGSQDVQLRYWLETADLQGPLTLEVNGQRLEVKSAQPLDIATLKNGEKKVIKGTAW